MSFLSLLLFLILSMFTPPERYIVAAGSCTETEVVIVGAGASAIGAANTLYENGMTKFLILEAKDYIGGRVRNVNFAGVTLSLGAAWAHNTEANHSVWQLLKKYNMSVHLDEFSNAIYRDGETGAKLDASNAQTRLAAALKQVEEMTEMRNKKNLRDLPLDVALRMGGWQPATDLERLVEVMAFPFENAVDISKLSSSAFTTNRIQVDYLVKDQRGYGFVLSEESKKYAHKVLLNKVVVRVEWKEERNVYQLDVEDGSCYAAKYLLVTVSSGVLLENAIHFSPSLPVWKKQALSFFPMGYYCKYILEFEQQFWHSEPYVVVVSKHEDRYITLQNMKVNSLFPDKNLLILTSIGSFCKHDELRTDAEVKSDIMALLRRIYSINATDMTGILRSRWGKDPYVRGAYSYLAPGVSNDDLRAVQHPWGKIWFAGEYTNGKDLGYVHGAYASGISQAESMLACMRSQAACPKDFAASPQCESGTDAKTILLCVLSALVAMMITLLIRGF